MCQFQCVCPLQYVIIWTTKKHSTTDGSKVSETSYIRTENWILINATNIWISFYVATAKKQLISNGKRIYESLNLKIIGWHILRCLLLELYYAWFQLCHFFLNPCKLLSKRRKLWPKLEIMFKWFAQQYQKKLVALLPHQ